MFATGRALLSLPRSYRREDVGSDGFGAGALVQARGGRLRSRLPRRALLGASDLKATPSKETRFWSRFQSSGWGRELKFTVVSSTRTGLCTGALYIAPSRSSKASSVHWPLPPAVPTRGHGARALKSPRRGRATSWGGRVTSPRSLHLCCTKREERPLGSRRCACRPFFTFV